MRRCIKLLVGASWLAEYGDPDNAEDSKWLKTYSAYHGARPGQSYPPILMATRRRDDRVHPGHARKMAAKLHAWAMRLVSMRMRWRPRLLQGQQRARRLTWCLACVC
ncbi:prolyl oligopeptidase family serine peptidase [Bradyrhizobium cosmicum]|uniref:prolyl oligopeptidase family serine peptidase n=1 Tax=Bradyrhizobium cosmicum TaxID=1404864 RepID=UPI0028EEFB71|nr:prolyl oligopeptidase family serine peptidase [Bradyrhizobium cosmicum]